MDYNFNKWKEKVFSIITGVTDVFRKISDLTIQNSKCEKKLNELDSKHSSFNDERENSVMITGKVLILLQIVIVLTLDYVLLMNAILVAGDRFDWSEWLVYAIPSILVIAEFLVCFSISKKASERFEIGWFDTVSQYLIIVFLMGATVFSIVYDISGYVPEVDNISFATYLTSSVVIQVCIFIFSSILHVILIRNVPKIAEAIMYYVYYARRILLENRMARVSSELNKRVNPLFDARSNVLILEIHEFDQKYPGQKQIFLNILEQGIIDEINKRKGKNVL